MYETYGFEKQIDTVEEHLRLVSKLCEAAKWIDKERMIAFYTEGTLEKLK